VPNVQAVFAGLAPGGPLTTTSPCWRSATVGESRSGNVGPLAFQRGLAGGRLSDLRLTTSKLSRVGPPATHASDHVALSASRQFIDPRWSVPYLLRTLSTARAALLQLARACCRTIRRLHVAAAVALLWACSLRWKQAFLHLRGPCVPGSDSFTLAGWLPCWRA